MGSLFNLKCIINNQDKIITYNNESGLFMIDGVALDTSKLLSSIRQSRQLTSITVVFGNACNITCKYCSTMRNEYNFDLTHVDIDKFVEDLAIQNPRLNHVFILGGGEPFCYFKYIKKLVPKFKQVFPYISITVVSNGTLFSNEVTDFVLNNNLALMISLDLIRGNDRNKYRPDALLFPNTVYLMRQLNPVHKLVVNKVILPETANLVDSYNYLNDVVNQDQLVKMAPAPLMTKQPNFGKMPWFTSDQKKTVQDSLCYLLSTYNETVHVSRYVRDKLLKGTCNVKLSESSDFRFVCITGERSYTKRISITNDVKKCRQCLFKNMCYNSYNTYSYMQQLACDNINWDFEMAVLRAEFKKAFDIDIVGLV